MSIVKTPLWIVPTLPASLSGPPNFGSSNQLGIIGLGQFVSYVGQMPSTETIDSVFFKIQTLTSGTSGLVKIEGVNKALSRGDNILVHPAASALVALSSTGDYFVRFDQPFTIPLGDYFCITIQQSGTKVPAGIQFTYFLDDAWPAGFPHTFGSNTFHGLAPTFGIGLHGVSAVPLQHCWPVTSVSALTFNSSSTINCIGNKIRINAPIRVIGIRSWLELDGNCLVNIFDVDGTTILRTASGFVSMPPVNNGQFRNDFYFSSPVTLTPGNTYYYAISANTAGTILTYTVNSPTSAWRTGSPMGGAEVHYTECKNPTSTLSWNDDLSKQAFLGLLVDGIDNGRAETSSVFAT